MRYISGLVNENPMLRRMVVRENSEAIEFGNRAAIEVHTASHRAVRGYTLSAAILDECAFWLSEGASPDVEIVAALRPALATLGGPLVALSSPYSRRGVLWNTYRRHFGQEGRVLVAQAPSRTMNPMLPQRVVDDAMLSRHRDEFAPGLDHGSPSTRRDVRALDEVCGVDASWAEVGEVGHDLHLDLRNLFVIQAKQVEPPARLENDV